MSLVNQGKRNFSTKSSSEVINLQWKIDNFKAMVDAVEPLKSAHLKFDAGQSINMPTTWKFDFEIKDVANGKLGIFLELLDSPGDCKKVYAEYEVVIKNAYGTDFKRLRSKVTDLIDVRWGFEDAFGLLSKALLDVLVNGALVIDINLEIFSFGKATDSVTNVEEISDKMSRSGLQEKSKNLVVNDLHKLFEKGNYSDFKIVMKDGKEFLVHKNILASRSPVFMTMFESDMEEASSGVVTVDDVSSETMELVLKFMYSGTVDEKWKEVVEEFVYAAEKYSLTLLKEFFHTMLVNAVTPENSIDLIKLARKFNLKKAEKDLMEYASQNFTDVFNKAIIFM